MSYLAPHPRLASLSVALLLIILISKAQGYESAEVIEPGMMSELMELHELDEKKVIERLARERNAAETQLTIDSLQFEGYGGSWFDPEIARLKVAVTNDQLIPKIEALGATAVRVSHSLQELERLDADIRASIERDSQLKDGVWGQAVNIRENRVDIYVAAPTANLFRSRFVQPPGSLQPVSVIVLDSIPKLTAGDVRGANGTRNFTWQQDFGGIWPCSIGAPIVGGYITAGHCGDPGDTMNTPSGQTLGTFKQSQWESGGDGGWVETATGWIPRPEVNGYSDGILTIPAQWAGRLEAPIGATVCRYGQTSGGPDCGIVAKKNVTVNFFGGSFDTLGRPILVTVNGLTEVNGVCTDDGDSGGPFITVAGQMQGTNTGGQPTNTCPNPSDRVWFQPINDTLSAYSKTMLTTHGAAAPVANGHICPNFADSGSGIYVCKIASYNSQGQTTLTWTSSEGHSSTSRFLMGSCSIGSWVTVNLALGNSYGTQNLVWTFPCPSGPLP